MYLNYYRLSQKPFEISTEPSFLWFGEAYKEAMATFKYGLYETSGFVVLTGDIGVGKTTMINALLLSLDKSILAVTVRDPALEKLDFFNFIARRLGLPGGYTSKGQFISALDDFLLKCYYKRRRVLLIIDESQLLSQDLLEEIRLIGNIEKKGIKLIHVFFVGQIEFNEILRRKKNRAIRQRITAHYLIKPLDKKETAAYIKSRLEMAGMQHKIFKKSAVSEIYLFSKGYPRLINVIADRSLLTGFVQSKKRIKKDIVRECAREIDIAGQLDTAKQDKGNKTGAKDHVFVKNDRSRNCRPYCLLAILLFLLVCLIIFYLIF